MSRYHARPAGLWGMIDSLLCVLEALLRGMMTSIVLLITAMCKVPGPPSYAYPLPVL